MEDMMQESTRAAAWTLSVIFSTLKKERVH